MIRKTIKFDEKIPIKFTFAERDLIIDETYAGGYLIDPLKMGLVEGKKIKAMYSYENLDELIGYIAASANHCENDQILTKLDKLFARLADIQELYAVEKD